MHKKTQVSETYDQMFLEDEQSNVFSLHYRYSPYYPLFKAVRSEMKKLNTQSVLEVGCGTGGLAHLLIETTKVKYKGFDFSPVAIDKARKRTNIHDQTFWVSDAFNMDYGLIDFDTIICTEVLEHLEKDIEVVEKWRQGCNCICSVPNFDSAYHVRYFDNEEDVLKRYGKLIKINSIKRVKKPFLNNLSFKHFLMALVWNRYRPKRLLHILGLSNFEEIGGWFLFHGQKL